MLYDLGIDSMVTFRLQGLVRCLAYEQQHHCLQCMSDAGHPLTVSVQG